MLDNLDNIDCSRVNHAYGPATDLPATLRALASGDKEQRERALWELHGNIWHQGTVYEATALAVPFLLELVRGKHPKSLEILWLLALIADGKSYGAAHGNLVKAADQEYQNQLARELEWVTRSKEAVAKGQTLFLEFLDCEGLQASRDKHFPAWPHVPCRSGRHQCGGSNREDPWGGIVTAAVSSAASGAGL